jgi:hypothetical protein
MASDPTKYWGERCPDFEPTCPCCAAWSLFDKLGRVPTDDEVDASIDAAWKAGGDDGR